MQRLWQNEARVPSRHLVLTFHVDNLGTGSAFVQMPNHPLHSTGLQGDTPT